MTTPITFDYIRRYRQGLRADAKPLLDELDRIVVSGRDHGGVPLYLTKARIKSATSIFLKTKRKSITSLTDITDFLGYRVLCLFEQDIPAVHDFLLRFFVNPGSFTSPSDIFDTLTLKEINIYSWDTRSADRLTTIAITRFQERCERLTPLRREHNEHLLTGVLNKKPIKVSIQYAARRSGYKAVHYVGTVKDIAIEVQLRTLLQDAWAELDHTLAYKTGNVHPHVSANFRILSSDLQNADNLITHLREVCDQERFGEKFSRHQSGPYHYFQHPGAFLSSFLTTNKSRELHEKYLDHVLETRAIDRDRTWTKVARQLIDRVTEAASGRAMTKKENWKKLEEAYIDFCEAEFEKALNSYNDLIVSGFVKKTPELYFRKGEIHFILGNIWEALAALDQYEEIVGSEEGEYSLVNVFHTKLKLAELYWTLGHEYYEFAVEKATEADRIFTSNREEFMNVRGKKIEEYDALIANNICYYYLERFVAYRDTEEPEPENERAWADYQEKCEEFYNETKIQYERLKKALKKYPENNNGYDTAAWFCFQSYRYLWGMHLRRQEGWKKLRRQAERYLRDANNYCSEVWDRTKWNSASAILTSRTLQVTHTKEISLAYDRLLGSQD